jgi:hypothetical protein
MIDNKKIPTWLGVTIIIIFSATTLTFVLVYEKNKKRNEVQNQNNAILNNPDLGKKRVVKQEKENVIENNQVQEVIPDINSQTNANQSIQVQYTVEKRLVGNGCYKMKNGNIDEQNFREDFNLDPADIMIKYENKRLGISFDIPYNKKWGNNDCVVLPYTDVQTVESDKENLKIHFGIFKAWIGDPYHFSTSKKRGAEDIDKEQNGGSPDPNPRTKTIGKHQVVIYESYGMGTQRIYEVLGDKNNYVFTQSWIKDVKSDSESDELEKIIKTLKIE